MSATTKAALAELRHVAARLHREAEAVGAANADRVRALTYLAQRAEKACRRLSAAMRANAEVKA